MAALNQISFLFALIVLLRLASGPARATSGLSPINNPLLSTLFIELNNKLLPSNSSSINQAFNANTTNANSKHHQPRGSSTTDKPFLLNKRSQSVATRQPTTGPSLAASNSSLALRRPLAAGNQDLQHQQPLLRLRPQASTTNLSLSAVRLRWRQMEQSVGDSLAKLANQLQENLDELGPRSAGLSTGCRLALHELIDGLASQRLWASQTVDASAKLPSGLLEGTLTELGHFDQCLGLAYQSSLRDETGRANAGPESTSLTTGQYCSIQIKPPLIPRARLHTICQRLPALSASSSNFSSSQRESSGGKTFRLLSQNSHNFYYAGLRLGLCTPSKCTKVDVQLLLNAYLAKFELLGQVKSCQVLGDEPRLDPLQQSIVLTLLGLVSLVILGTIVDLATTNKTIASGGGTMAANQQVNSSSESSCDSGQPGRRRRAPNGKRWLYQVYRSPPVACPLHQQPMSPGMQRNPLAMSQSWGDLGATSNGKAQIIGGQFATLHSMRFPEVDDCRLAAGGDEEDEEVMMAGAAEEEQLAEEEAWIAEMERNQALMNADKALPVHRPQTRKSSHKSSSGWKIFVRSALICFSLRSNLKLIGRHVATASKCACKGLQKEEAVDYEGRQGKAPSSKPVTAGESELADIKVIHGLRTITMVWIIFGHTIGLVNPEMMNNLFAVAQLSCSSRLLQALLNATLAVNTFFMISGLVTIVSLARRCDSAYRLLGGGRKSVDKTNAGPQGSSSSGDHNGLNGRDLESSSLDSVPSSINSSLGSSSKCMSSSSVIRKATHRKRQQQALRANRRSATNASRRANKQSWPADFQPLAWLAMRYLRLTPAYAATIGLSILMPLVGTGPFWQESAGQLGPVCRENWWSNLLYANNFINTDRLCLIHSWYLSNDWQFFLLTMVLLTIGYRSRRLALVLLVSILVASSAATFALTVANDLPPTIVSTSPAVAERWLFIHSLYYKPWPHLSSYLIGLLTGYLLINKQRIRLSRASCLLSWLAASVLAFALLNSIYPWNMGLQVEPLLTGLHSATFRGLWAACCAWLVFALASRPEAPLAKLLGWHGFQVSSRLTYCAYLVHPLIIYYHFGTLRERMDSSIYGQFHRFMATFGLSYLMALLLSLLVESPSIQLQRLLVDSLWKRGTGSDGSRGTGGREQRNNRSSPTTSGASWIGTSSFGEQGSATSSNLALVSAMDHNEQLDSKMLHSCCHQLEPMMNIASHKHHNVWANPQRVTQPETNIGDDVAPAAVDADFQQKLAQAISRGFRLRSKLVNGSTIKSPAGIARPRAGGFQGDALHGGNRRLPTGVVQQTHGEKADAEVLARPANHLPSEATKSKKVEFSTFFVGNQHPTSQQGGGLSTTTAVHGEQLANAAMAERQRRRSHDLMMKAGNQTPFVATQSTRTPTHFHQQYHHQQQQVASEMVLLRQQAAHLTRSQNQLDQYNPRTRGSERR